MPRKKTLKKPSFSAIIRDGVLKGKKEFVLLNATEVRLFYNICQDVGYNSFVAKNPETSGYKGYVKEEIPAIEKEDRFIVPDLWSKSVIFDENKKPLLKFLQVPELKEEDPGRKLNFLFPKEWFFVSRIYNIMVQPRFSESPAGCLTNLAMPVGSLTEENTMIACDETGKFFGWDLSIARSLRSIPTGSQEIPEEIVLLGFEHLRALGTNLHWKDFKELCRNENNIKS